MLIDKLGHSAKQSTTLRNISTLFKELGIEVIAEGVETQKQAELLQQMNVFLQQGYFHARPMLSESLAGWLAHKKKKIDKSL